MKKNDLFIILSTSAYSYLFYHQAPGINFFLFNVLLISLLFIRKPDLIRERQWLFAATGSIISSFFVCWWSTFLPVCANFCSLLMLVGFSFKPDTSLLVAITNTSFSLVASFLYAPFKSSLPNPEAPQAGEGIFKKIVLFIIPVFVTLIFFFIYRAANPVFEKLTDKINWDFISFDWILFTAFGFVLMFGVFRYLFISTLVEMDYAASDSLSNLHALDPAQSVPGQWMKANNEYFMGVTMFFMLNLLLLLVNALDVYCLWIIQRVPGGLTVADYLHEGAGSLILSIILAIAVILFVFRSSLNFYENNKGLKLLCYAWIGQNAFMLITTAHKNWWIIESSGLTRKRIGIYVYLVLCLIGLVTTCIKVRDRKSNWFLFRKNSWAFYAVFIVACFFNWDNIIVQYNCGHFKSIELSYIDREYQAELSHTCLANLFQFYVAEQNEKNPQHKIFNATVVRDMYDNYEQLEKEKNGTGWQSYSVSKKFNRDAVEAIIQQGKAPANCPVQTNKTGTTN